MLGAVPPGAVVASLMHGVRYGDLDQSRTDRFGVETDVGVLEWASQE